jgi:hypothetical protein
VIRSSVDRTSASIANEMAPFIDDARNGIGTCPAIENHAQDLLQPDGARSNIYLTMTPESTDGALKSATNVSRLF